MNICEENHDEIVYIGIKCPLCTVLDELDNVEGELRAAELRIDDLKAELEASE